ncbi:MAG: type II secretion system protein GspG [Pseudomonadota bacterium]
MFWRKKKFICVIEPRRKKARKAGGRFLRIRNIVIIVLGLFIVIWSVEYEKNRLKRRQAAVDILRLQETADEYLWENGRCPKEIEDIVRPSSAEAKKKQPNWMRAILDPWGKKYEFICPGKKYQGSVDIISSGPDRSYYTIDDVKIN